MVKGKNQNTMTTEDISVLIEAYRTALDPDGPDFGAYVHVADFDEIKHNDFDLNVGRYIKKTAVETADLGTALTEYAEARATRIRTEVAMFDRLAGAGIDLSMFEVPDE